MPTPHESRPSTTPRASPVTWRKVSGRQSGTGLDRLSPS